MRTRTALAALVVLSLFLAGCTGAPGSEDATASSTTVQADEIPTTVEDPPSKQSSPGVTTARAPNESATTESSADSAEARVTVEGGTLPVDADTVLERVEALMGQSVDAPTLRVTTREDSLSDQVESRIVPTVFGLDGWREGNGSGGTMIRRGQIVELYPGDGSDSDIERVLAHEFAHVVQFRSDIAATWMYRKPGSTDESQARLAVIEGGAVYVADRYASRYMNASRPQFDKMALEYRRGPPGNRFFRSRYFFGARYFHETLESPRNLTGAFRTAPAETETLIHNHTDGPQPPLDVRVNASDGWEKPPGRWIWNDTKGELVVRNVLRSELPRSRAAPGAAGWGTDRFFALQKPNSSTFGTVWALRWENASEADEFATAFRAYADRNAPTSKYKYRLTRIDSETTVVFAGNPSFVANATASGTNSAVTVTLSENS